MGSPSSPPTDRRWLRLSPAAELLGVSINTLRRWSDAGKVTCYRSAGGHRRFRRVDIEALLREGAGGAASRRAARPAAPASEAAAITALEARTHDLELLIEAGIEDVSQLSTGDVLQSVARRLARLTHSPVADIYAVDGENLKALVSYDHGTFDRSWEGTTVRLRDFPCSAIAVDQRRIAVAASLDDPVLTQTGRASLQRWGYQSQLSAPIVVRDAVIGILELSDYVPRDFGEHLRLIEGLAHVAGRALDNAALFDEIRRRNVILHELVEFGALATGAGDVTELLRIAAKRLVETLDAADCDVFTLEGDRLLSRVSYDRDGYDDDSVGHSLRVDDFPNVKAAIESQEIAVIASPDDPRIDTEERRVFAEWGFKSNLSLPLVVDGVVNGLIDIYGDEPGDYAEYVDFLKTVGQLLAGALGKARLLERLEESNNELRELVDSGLEFGSSLELEEVLYSVAERMRGLAGAEECEIVGLEPPHLVVRIAVGPDGRNDAEVGARRPIDARRAAQRAIETRQPVAVYDASADDSLGPQERALFLESSHVASIRLPLIVRGEVIGLVALFDSHAREFSRVQLLQGLAQIAAQAMANARLLDEAKHRADVLRELVDLGALIWRTHDVDSLAHVVAQRLTTTIGAYCCEVFRLDDETLRCIASYDTDDGFDEERRGAPLLELDQFPSTVHAIAAIEPLVVASRDDQRLTATELALYERWGFNSELCIPVAVEGRVVGLIDVFDRVPREYRTYLDFILSVGQMVAGAFENASLLDRLNSTNRELETLVQSGLEFGSTLDLDQVLGSVASRIYSEAEVACCDIAIIEDETLRGLVSVDERGVDAEYPGTTYDLADLGVAREVIDSGQPLAIVDARNDPRVSAFELRDWQSHGYVSALRLPLLFGGRVAGFVSLFDTRPREFAHLGLLRGLAQVAAQAVANATLYRRLDESSRRLAVVNDVSLQLSSTLELRDVLLPTAYRMCETGSTPACDIYLVSGSDLLCVASVKQGQIVEQWEGTVTPLANWSAVELAIAGRTTVQLSSLDDPRRNAAEIEELRGYGYQAELIVPLVAKGRVIGVVDLLDFERRQFSTDAVATVEAVCRAAALAIDNANLFEAVQLRRRETELLNAIARRTASSLRLDEIAGATADELRQIIAFERADLVLIAPGNRLETIYSSDVCFESAGQIPLSPEQRDALDTIRRDRVVVWEAGATPSFDGRAAAVGDAGASIALLHDEELIGVLDLAGPAPHVFASVDRHLLERVGTHLSLAINNARLYDEIKRMHLGNLKALSSALNAKDYYTLGHAARVGAYMVLLGHELGWPEETVHQVEEAAYLHDIGKIGVSDRVLLKPSGLNSREWELMRQHPIFSADILRPLFADDLVLGVRHHHEHWDGTGYPDGLAGADIPLVARAMCVADSYDAMSFRRPYRQALPYHEALLELDRCSATQFDPEIVAAFKRVLARLQEQRTQAREAAARGAARIDPAEHATLRVSLDESRPEYQRIAAELRDIRDDNPQVRFLTTVVVDDDAKCAIIVDAEEVAQEHSPLGSEVFADDELLETFAGGAPDVNVLYVDQWGVWVCGLAPVRDRQGEVVAVVEADVPPAGVSGAEMEGLRSDVAQAFASMFQTAAARLSRTELDAITDGLTGLYNHRYLHERLSEEIGRAREDNRPLSLLFCGLDQFKAFNESYGHSAGDDALRGVARIVDGCIRHIDLAARYGGEEFAVILLGSDADAAAEVAERLRSEVAAFPAVVGKDAHLTISIGVASFPADAGLKEELLDKADWAMHLAKRRGRDRVVTFTSGQSSDDAASEVGVATVRPSWAALADAVDGKHQAAGTRSRDAARIAALVALELGFDDDSVRRVVEAARLSDIGEIGVPDGVLNKPGELTADEWRLIREHPVAGERLLRSLGAGEQLAQAAAHHHERFDGSGYPSGLAGEAIPLHSRVVLVATAYSAMTGRRPYAPQLTADETVAELRRCAGTQFDPTVVEALASALTGARGAPERA